MTSEQIDNLQSTVMQSEIDTPEKAKISAMLEIAYQLACLNEHFRKADESVFGVKDHPNKGVDMRNPKGTFDLPGMQNK